MPKGPRGEKRPADVVGNAVLIGKIATGEVKDTRAPSKNPHAVELGKLGGKKGGKARAKRLSAKKRREIASNAANVRWKNSP
jgi:hypothetical protein